VALLLVPWTLTLIPLFLTIQKLHFFNTWWALILPYAASAQPLLVLIFRGFFEQIPRELLEGARVDGCAERQVLARIVVPLTRPVLLTGVILVMINVWGDYLWPTIPAPTPPGCATRPATSPRRSVTTPDSLASARPSSRSGPDGTNSPDRTCKSAGRTGMYRFISEPFSSCLSSYGSSGRFIWMKRVRSPCPRRSG
jgi:hypothetical protein